MRTASRPAAASPITGGGLPGAIASEWTKLWSVRSVWWSLLASALLMGAAAAQFAIYVANSNTNPDRTDDQGIVSYGSVAFSALDLAQFAIIALAMLMITSEYATGTIRATLQWTPVRIRVLAAKATVVGAVTFVIGALLMALSCAAAAPLLGDWGRFEIGEAIRDALAVGAYTSLISLFTLGIGAALRSAVGTLTMVFLILAVVPAMMDILDNPVVERVTDAMPGVAGGHFLHGDTEPYPPVVGRALLAGWALAALLAGWAVMRRRDA
jgi:ABC-2 type transport system permease protein